MTATDTVNQLLNQLLDLQNEMDELKLQQEALDRRRGEILRAKSRIQNKLNSLEILRHPRPALLWQNDQGQQFVCIRSEIVANTSDFRLVAALPQEVLSLSVEDVEAEDDEDYDPDGDYDEDEEDEDG